MNPPHLNADTEALLQGYLEGTLTPEDSARLLASLKAQPELVGILLDGLQMDALIREVVRQTAAATRTASTIRLPENVSEERSRRRKEADQDPFSRLKSASLPRRLRPLWNRPVVLALAASVVFFLGLAAWYFGPTVGSPVLSEVKGNGASIERGTESIPAANGMVLQAADVLRLGSNSSASIAFGTEQTQLKLSAGTELKLASLARGKRFVLQAGRIEAYAAHQRPFHPMIVSTPQAEARVLGTKFSLLTTASATRLEVAEGKVGFTRLSDSKGVQVGAGSYAVAASNYALAAQPLPGKVLREFWLDLPGDSVLDLKHHPRFPHASSGHDYPASFETDTNWPSAFGTRFRGYLMPPVNGDYEFRISGNGQMCLWLSPDEDVVEMVKIGQFVFTRNRPGDPGPQAPASRKRQESGPIPLEAGHRYYIEAIHKHETGEDQLSITWKRPDGTTESIPSEFLAPFKLNAKEKKR